VVIDPPEQGRYGLDARETLNMAYVLTRRWPRAADEPALRPVVDQTALAHWVVRADVGRARRVDLRAPKSGAAHRCTAARIAARAEGAKAWVRQRKTAQLFAGATALALMLRVRLGDVGGGADDLADSCCADLS